MTCVLLFVLAPQDAQSSSAAAAAIATDAGRPYACPADVSGRDSPHVEAGFAEARA